MLGHPCIRYSILPLHLTAGSDYRPGPYTVSFSAGQPLAVLRVSTIDDGTAELSENFTVMIKSVDSLGNVEIGSHSSSFVRIVSGKYATTYVYRLSLILCLNVCLVTCNTSYSVSNSYS